VVGVDPCTRGLEAGRRHARESGLNIRYLAGIGQSIPLEDDSVDRVVCVDVLEHVRDFPSVLSEIRRVLRPGGTLFFDCVNRNWFARLVVVTMAEVILRVLPLGTHDPDLFIRPDELTAHLESLGFRVSPIAGMRPVRLNRRIDFVFGLLPPRAVTYIGHAVLT
jgi:2-polyprenyl-6-hydroxyphenyl methylase/3-demethylubiquinone-9 3-methyltransferase